MTARPPRTPPKPTAREKALEERVADLEKQLRWLIWVTQQMTMDEARKAMGSP